MLLTGRQTFSNDDFIESWLAAFKRDPRTGYSQHMYKTMQESKDAADFRSRIDGRGTTSGGMMRAGVFGLIGDIDRVKALTLQQAKITHDTEAGRNGALAVALGVHYLHHGGHPGYVSGFLDDQLGEDWGDPSRGYTTETGNALNIATQMIGIVSQCDSLSRTLLHGANWARKSDTDTLCALSLMMASRGETAWNDLPHRLYATLENSAYGLDYLQALDMKLMRAFPRQPLYGRWLEQKVTTKPSQTTTNSL